MKMKSVQGVFVLVLVALTSLHSLDIEIYPSTICYQEHDNLVLRCLFSENDTFGAEFLFKSRDQPDEVYKLNATKLNSNTIETRVQDIKIPYNIGTYFCAKDGIDNRQITYIEEKVVLPDDVQCYHDKFYQSLICEWTGKNSTCWDFSVVNSDLGYYVKDKTCNISTSCTELSPITNCVQARHSTDVVLKAVCPKSFLNRKQIDFKITGRKFTSVSSRIIHKTMDCSSVKLRVSNLKSQNSSTTSQVLAWEVHGAIEENCDCMKKCVVITNQSTPVIVTRSCYNDTLYKVELKQLQQLTNYTTVIKCTVMGSEVWSDEQLVTFTTPFGVPSGGLLAGPDLEGYVMYTCHKRFYCLVLYWKDLGNFIKTFRIHVSDMETSFELEVPNSPIATIRLNKTRSCQQFNMNVFGVTANGIETQITSFRVMDHTCGCFNRIICKVLKGNESHMILKLTQENYLGLKSTGGNNDCDVIVFWCLGHKHNLHVECEDFIQWSNEVLNKTVSMVSINRESHRGSLYVGLGLKFNGQSTGIEWDTCIKENNASVISKSEDKTIIAVIISVICGICMVVLLILLFGCSRRKICKGKNEHVVNTDYSTQTILTENHQNTERKDFSPTFHQEIDSYVCSIVVDHPNALSSNQTNDSYDGSIFFENTTPPRIKKVIDSRHHTNEVQCISNSGQNPGYLSPNELTPTNTSPGYFSNLNNSDDSTSNNSSHCHEELNLSARLSTKSISSYCKANQMNSFSEDAAESEKKYSSKCCDEVNINLDYISTEGMDSNDGKYCITTEKQIPKINGVNADAENNPDYISTDAINSINDRDVYNMDYISI